MKRGIFFAFILWGFSFGYVYAYQPYAVKEGPVNVERPETSRLFYDTLTGSPRTYRVTNDKEFDFSVKIFTPDRGVTTTFSGYISRIDGDLETFVGALEGESALWEKTYEAFGGNWYRNGPEFNTLVPGGVYAISIFNEKNVGTYALAIGEKESFTPKDVIRTMTFLPKIKSDFFGTSYFSMFISPFGVLWIIMLALIIVSAWALVFFVFKKYIVLSQETKERFRKNLGRKDRHIRLLVGIVIFFFAIGFWNYIFMAIGGLFLFEALMGWCVLYAISGKSTCRVSQDLVREE